MAAQEAAFFGLPTLAYDVGEIALFCAPGGSVLVPVGDEAALRSRLAHLLREPRALAAMQDAAHSFAGTLRARLASRPSLQAATGEFASLLRRASARASAAARAADAAVSAAHAVRVRGPVCAALGLHAALLLLLPIPSEASSLDRALGTARAAGKQVEEGHPSALSILLAAAPVLLVAWPPLLAGAARPFLAAALRRPLPLRLGRPSELVQTGATSPHISPYLPISPHVSPCALGLLFLSSALSVSAVLTLRTCLATAPHSLCTHASFAWSRNPICVSSVGLALSLSALLPSVVSAVGTVWLALHLGRQVGGPEERRLAEAFGESWRSYAEEVPAVGSLESLAISALLITGCGVLLHALLPAAVLPGEAALRRPQQRPLAAATPREADEASPRAPPAPSPVLSRSLPISPAALCAALGALALPVVLAAASRPALRRASGKSC
ncbi:hypothetical protein EMIHUDRAFT_468627 [Emiliania huxleyi CCMP1516]|uniref:Glycosyl transferase family 1 domain-containing protein n=2 Tax=Emiliania huxleyi TaxID=2903 RepID=A0A0D3JZD7_EMIH1|nr:hypothetical protein EMIHUDRAFT_468627 [Emiliania huxleyi CCMP1516]EOD28872.1 hypothetical protein EMIHUDRAFT_468627 [Emiliania huxleyi CCMP1516]|eukprot:XP_005781301.1 hypothetical protein EMIHUDRAFT_468627 [Emiliania huxleyi CCMP1516]